MIYKVIFNPNQVLYYSTLSDINIRYNLDLEEYQLPQFVSINNHEALVDKFDR